MTRTNHSTNLSTLPTLVRGLYQRVAERTGVDPSYVSRVARGERQSPVVEKALAAELKLVLRNSHDGHGNSDGTKAKANAKAGKRKKSLPSPTSRNKSKTGGRGATAVV